MKVTTISFAYKVDLVQPVTSRVFLQLGSRTNEAKFLLTEAHYVEPPLVFCDRCTRVALVWNLCAPLAASCGADGQALVDRPT